MAPSTIYIIGTIVILSADNVGWQTLAAVFTGMAALFCFKRELKSEQEGRGE